MPEYLDGIKAKYNTDKYTALEVSTDKDTYIAKLPYTIKHKENREDVFHYSLSIKDWCSLRKIIIKDYFGFKHQSLIHS